MYPRTLYNRIERACTVIGVHIVSKLMNQRLENPIGSTSMDLPSLMET
jgi:hypothetical protein